MAKKAVCLSWAQRPALRASTHRHSGGPFHDPNVSDGGEICGLLYNSRALTRTTTAEEGGGGQFSDIFRKTTTFG